MEKASMENFDQNSIFSDLKQNDQVIKFLLEKAPMGIAFLDTDAYFLKVNPKFAKSIGYNIEDVAGMHSTDISCPLFFASDADGYSKLLKGEIKTLTVTKQYFSRDGKALDIQVNLFTYYIESNKTPYIIGFYQNCKPFYKEYLVKINSNFTGLLEHNPYPGILIFRQDGRCLFGSNFAANVLGYTEQEVCNLSLTELFCHEQVEKILNIVSGKFSGRFFECELKFLHRDDRIVYILSQLFIDETNYFKNGRMLILFFNNEPGAISYNQHSRREVWEKIFFFDVGNVGTPLKYFGMAGGFKGDEINLSDYKLTEREKDVLKLFLNRKNTKEIAYELCLAEITIRKHFTSLYRKFGVSCREELLLMLYGKNIV